MNIEHNPAFPETAAAGVLKVCGSGWVTTDSSWTCPPLPSPYSRLYLVTGGSGMLLSEREQLKLEPGFAYLAPCGCPCGFYGTDSVTKLYFHINLPMPDGYDLFASCHSLARIPFPASRMIQLRDWYLSGEPLQHMLLKGALWELSAAFAEKLCTRNRGNCSPTVTAAISYIRGHLNAQLSVGEVCGAIFTSPGHLTKSFRREVGVTVARFIEDLIMQEAQQLLLSTDQTVGVISQCLGFCDQFYFTRRFSHRYGLTPREYRKLHKNL